MHKTHNATLVCGCLPSDCLPKTRLSLVVPEPTQYGICTYAVDIVVGDVCLVNCNSRIYRDDGYLIYRLRRGIHNVPSRFVYRVCGDYIVLIPTVIDTPYGALVIFED